MKKIVLFLAVAMSGTSLMAQKSVTVPVAVKTAFQKKYPGATKVTWGKENATEYEAEFTNGAQTLAANFNVSGAWV